MGAAAYLQWVRGAVRKRLIARESPKAAHHAVVIAACRPPSSFIARRSSGYEPGNANPSPGWLVHPRACTRLSRRCITIVSSSTRSLLHVGASVCRRVPCRPTRRACFAMGRPQPLALHATMQHTCSCSTSSHPRLPFVTLYSPLHSGRRRHPRRRHAHAHAHVPETRSARCRGSRPVPGLCKMRASSML